MQKLYYSCTYLCFEVTLHTWCGKIDACFMLTLLLALCFLTRVEKTNFYKISLHENIIDKDNVTAQVYTHDVIHLGLNLTKCISYRKIFYELGVRIRVGLNKDESTMW